MFRYVVFLLLLAAFGVVRGGYGDAYAVNHAARGKMPIVSRTLWVQPASFQPKPAWLSLSASQIAKLGTQQKLPLFAGNHVSRLAPAYALPLHVRDQAVALWGSTKKISFDPHTFSIVDAWEGLLGGKPFALDVYKRQKGSLFVLADAYDHRIVTSVAFTKPLYWMTFTGRFVTFCVPYPTTGFYAGINLTNGQRITNRQMAQKIAGMWETMGGYPGSLYGLVKNGYGGTSSKIPGVNYAPYYYAHE